jgi:tRNA-2-methylthio-N6-dimethylallyladenosine synthase
MKDKKYTVVTYGCQMNEHDSEEISWILENMGYVHTDDIEDSDLIIYNTCLVRENAELKVYGKLGALKELKRRKPETILGVCGCMMQRKDIRDIILKKYRHVDIIFGTNNINKLPELINTYYQTGNTVVDVVDDIGTFHCSFDNGRYLGIIPGEDYAVLIEM